MINVGLASFGMSGQVFHAPFIHTNKHFRLCAILERSKQLSLATPLKATIVRSFEELIGIPEIELIVVNTPDSLHYEHTKKALEAGKHVVVEKPFTPTSAQGEELIALAKEKGLMLSVYQNRRWDSDYLTVKQIIEEGRLGRLVEFESTFPRFRNYIAPNTWKETGKLGGGLLYNLGAHLIDQALQLFGKPKAIYADIDTLRTGGMVDDYFCLHLIEPERFPKLKVTLKSSYLMCEEEPRFMLHGTEGSFSKYGLDPQEEYLKAGIIPISEDWGQESEKIWGTISTTKDSKLSQEKYRSISGNYRAFYQEIYKHLRKGEPLSTDATSVIDTIKIIETAYENNRKVVVINT